MLELIEKFHSLAPQLLDTLMALVALCTSLQLVFVTLAKLVSFVSPKAGAALDSVAHWLGIAALDVKQATDGVKKAIGKAPDSKKTLGALLFCVVLFVPGCTSFMHFSDPTLDDMVAKLCGEKLDEAMPQISSEAAKVGVPVAELVTAFQTACLFRAKRGLDDGGPAGMDAVYGKIAAKKDPAP